MTVALATATASSAPTKANDPASPASKDAAKFDKLMDTADQADAAETPPATPPADDKALAKNAAPDQTLEALLQSLRTSLLPGAALPGKTAAKSADPAKADDKPAEDPKDDAAPLSLPNLIFAQLPPALVPSKAASIRLGLDDVSAKADKRAPIPATDPGALAALVTAPSLPADLMTANDTAVATVAQPDRAAASLDRLVDTARDAAWLDRLSRDIAESAGAGDRVRFRMLPPSLGALDVAVERHAAGLSVSMTTHTPEARNMIADARQQMVDGLKAQGVPLVQFSLTSAGEDQAGHRPPTFFNHLIEVAAPAGTELAASPEDTVAERMGRFA
ncbi:hypothetical protein SPAN111604_13580 [Sphingomonas antarctica]|uniref:flagellar hook-length control protein FliK n=1 Tax=Sphingomonas antarctica TaxID=2040274 RepID=UPI0039E85D89